MNRQIALRFIRQHGIVLESAHGRVVTFADAVVGARIRGSWWAHPRSHEIFWLTRTVRESPDVLVCRLVDGKITYVHRRLWPALVRLASELGRERLAAVREVHTAAGKHVAHLRAFPSWVPPAVAANAKRLSLATARAALGLPQDHQGSARPHTPAKPTRSASKSRVARANTARPPKGGRYVTTAAGSDRASAQTGTGR